MSWMRELIAQHKTKPFLKTESAQYSYQELLQELSGLSDFLSSKLKNTIVILESEHSFDCCVKVLSLLDAGVAFALLPSYLFQDEKYHSFLENELNSSLVFVAKKVDLKTIKPAQAGHLHSLIQSAINEKKSTFIVRTSGSSGNKNKLILHDAALFIKKYQTLDSHFKKTFSFSPAESIAGFETLLECITHGCELISSEGSYKPDHIAKLLSESELDYFQTTPSFLNLLLFSGQLKKEKLNHLVKIAYGSEPMYAPTTSALKKELPDVELMHTYGMSEIGILKTITPQDSAFKLKLDPQFHQWRINAQKHLEVTTLTPFIGFLNYPNTHLADNFFDTCDLVEEDGEFLKILGREGDLINVGGQKFLPSELEALLLEMPEIEDVAIAKEPHILMSTAVIANVVLKSGCGVEAFKSAFKVYCENKLPRFMHPQKLNIIEGTLVSDRFKKLRKS